jgi:hypothetical protein
MFEKKFAKKVRKCYKLSEGGREEGREGGREEGRGGRGGWRIVIPMPEAINFVDGRRQKYTETFSAKAETFLANT